MKSLSLYFSLIFFFFYQIEKKAYGQAAQNQTIHLKFKNLADSLFSLGTKNYKAGNANRALTLFEKSIMFYKKNGQYQNIGDCYSRMGNIFYFQGDYLKTQYFLKQSLGAYKKTKSKKEVATILNNLGAVNYNLGIYPEAVENYKQAADIQEEIGDKILAGVIKVNIGGVYAKVKDYTNAMKYYNNAHTIFKELKDKKEIGKILIEIGYVYMKQDNFEKAKDNFNQALIIASKEKDKQLELETLSNLGELYLTKSDFQKASYYFNLCLKNAEEINDLRYKSGARISIGGVLNHLNRYKEAEQKCKTGLKFAEQLKSISLKKEACDCLYKANKSLGKSLLALQYYEKSNVLEDSLNSQETANKILNMEFEKQQLVDSISNVKKQNLIEVKHKEEVQKKEKQRNVIIASLFFMLIVAVGLAYSLRFVKKSRAILKIEKDRSEALLLNILPEEIAEELKQTGTVNAREFDLVSILFSDFKSFTQTAEKMSPHGLVEEINICFKAFDLITEKYRIEKIKTIGDAYMAAGGFPNHDENSPKNIVLAGLEMQDFIIKRTVENQAKQLPSFEMRLGVHNGPIVAGIVGVKKFQYDVWGDTVNTASRVESNGMVGKVNISQTLYELIKNEDCFEFEYRGNINVKGKGEIKMYFVKNNPMFNLETIA
jgi:adenylate cyclase